MDLISALGRALLVGTFVLSAVAKATDLSGTRASARSLGLPESLAGPCAVALVVIEGALALGLVAGSSVVISALGLVMLLALFSATVIANVARDNRPDCGCFGPLTGGRIGPITLARNGALAALAVLVAVTAEDSLPSAIADLDPPELAVGLLVLGSLALIVRRSGGRAGAGLVGAPAVPSALQVDDEAPPFDAHSLHGDATTLHTLLEPGAPVLLVFASTTCGACGAVLAQLGTWQAASRAGLTVAFLISGPIESAREAAERHGLRRVALDPDNEVAHAYRLTATPAAALIGPDGRLAARVAHGGPEVFNLLLDGLGLQDVVAAHIDTYEADADDEGAPDLRPDEVELRGSPATRRAVLLLEHAGDHVLLDRELGSVVLINSSAATIWRCLDGVSSLDEIARDISDVFDVELSGARDDVVSTAQQLAAAGMLARSSHLRAEGPRDRPTVT